MVDQATADAIVAPYKAKHEKNRLWFQSLDESLKTAARDLLPNAIDFHVHCDPSPAKRSVDAFQAAEEASAAGMRAIVLKDHRTDMGDAAWLAMRHARIQPPFEVLGSVWLNNHVGGWNPYAVDKSIVFGTRLVAGPTVAGGGQIARDTESGSTVHVADVMSKGSRRPRPAVLVPTLDVDGRCRPEVIECIDLIAEAGDVVLGTGHLDKQETFALVRAAKERGVERLCLTHATLVTGASPEELRDFCDETGAVAEFSTTQTIALAETVAAVFRTIGLDHVTVSSDAGIAHAPNPVDYYQYALAALLEAGMTEDEIVRVAHRNPARLLYTEALASDEPAGDRPSIRA